MTLVQLLPLFGGLGLFLYGMTIMGEGLEKIAGSKMELMLEKFTSTKLRGVLLGAAVTAVIQSSSATTVMVVGFVNAGIMKLSGAISVIMGANIGTTVTAWILTLSDITGSNWFFTLIKPNNMAPVLIAVGAYFFMFSKKKRKKEIGTVLLGFGMLFFGMNTMEVTLIPLRELDAFKELFLNFKNPIFGILVGALVTAAIQSSSASVGILQALAATGLVSFSTAVPIIMGQNIGTCITVMLASIGANKNAKRAALVHLYFNIIGTVVFTVGIYSYQYFVKIPFWDQLIDRAGISMFHTAFNLINVLWMLPFTGILLKLVTRGAKEEEENSNRLSILDERFIQTPAVALDQCVNVLNSMGSAAYKNIDRSFQLLHHYDQKLFLELVDEENFIDKCDAALSNYVVKITGNNLSDSETRLSTSILHELSDFERIGDHAMNLAETAQYNYEHNIEFSEQAIGEVKLMSSAVKEIMSKTFKAYMYNDLHQALEVEPLEQVIDGMEEMLKNQHIRRLQQGKCTVEAGISFLSLLTNFERISDHCSNIALGVIRSRTKGSFDSHETKKLAHVEATSDYQKIFDEYSKKYLEKIDTVVV